MLGDLMMSPPWDQHPPDTPQMGRLRPEVTKNELKASGWLPQQEAPGWGCYPRGVRWSWRCSQGSGSLLEAGLSPSRVAPPLTLPGSSPAPTHDSTLLKGL